MQPTHATMPQAFLEKVDQTSKAIAKVISEGKADKTSFTSEEVTILALGQRNALMSLIQSAEESNPELALSLTADALSAFTGLFQHMQCKRPIPALRVDYSQPTPREGHDPALPRTRNHEDFPRAAKLEDHNATQTNVDKDLLKSPSL